eukprot:TRINITY_DN14857_c3_g1_i1.p1 TRINITY_DN14857_c3_g1~~TRINITY_DN14857_c3_g1_i1.p1  ORF type:complete len:1401 (+),score=410.76 TRINITY_DN14857_c3_g1_i1:87-4205(+)
MAPPGALMMLASPSGKTAAAVAAQMHGLDPFAGSASEPSCLAAGASDFGELNPEAGTASAASSGSDAGVTEALRSFTQNKPLAPAKKTAAQRWRALVPVMRLGLARLRRQTQHKLLTANKGDEICLGLQSSPLMALWPACHLRVLAERCTPLHTQPGDPVVREGEMPGMGLLVLSEGIAQEHRLERPERRASNATAVTFHRRRSSRKAFRRIRPPAVLGDFAVLTEEPQEYVITSETACVWYVIPRSVFLSEMDTMLPGVRNRVYDIAFERRLNLMHSHWALTVRDLRRSFLFADLSDSELQTLLFRLEPRCIRRGQHLCHAGEDAREIYFLRRGELEVAALGRGETMPLRAINAFGELSLVFNEPRVADVVARTHCDLWVLSSDGLIALCGLPGVRDKLLAAASARRIDWLRDEVRRGMSKGDHPLRKYIARCPLIRDVCSEDCVDEITCALEPSVYLGREVIVEGASVCDSLLLLGKGSALVQQDDYPGDHFLRVGEAVGFSCIGEHEWNYPVVALETCDVWSVSRSGLFHILKRHGALASCFRVIRKMLMEKPAAGQLGQHTAQTLLTPSVARNASPRAQMPSRGQRRASIIDKRRRSSRLPTPAHGRKRRPSHAEVSAHLLQEPSRDEREAMLNLIAPQEKTVGMGTTTRLGTTTAVGTTSNMMSAEATVRRGGAQTQKEPAGGALSGVVLSGMLCTCVRHGFQRVSDVRNQARRMSTAGARRRRAAGSAALCCLADGSQPESRRPRKELGRLRPPQCLRKHEREWHLLGQAVPRPRSPPPPDPVSPAVVPPMEPRVSCFSVAPEILVSTAGRGESPEDRALLSVGSVNNPGGDRRPRGDSVTTRSRSSIASSLSTVPRSPRSAPRSSQGSGSPSSKGNAGAQGDAGSSSPFSSPTRRSGSSARSSSRRSSSSSSSNPELGGTRRLEEARPPRVSVPNTAADMRRAVLVEPETPQTVQRQGAPPGRQRKLPPPLSPTVETAAAALSQNALVSVSAPVTPKGATESSWLPEQPLSHSLTAGDAAEVTFLDTDGDSVRLYMDEVGLAIEVNGRFSHHVSSTRPMLWQPRTRMLSDAEGGVALPALDLDTLLPKIAALADAALIPHNVPHCHAAAVCLGDAFEDHDYDEAPFGTTFTGPASPCLAGAMVVASPLSPKRLPSGHWSRRRSPEVAPPPRVAQVAQEKLQRKQSYFARRGRRGAPAAEGPAPPQAVEWDKGAQPNSVARAVWNVNCSAATAGAPCDPVATPRGESGAERSLLRRFLLDRPGAGAELPAALAKVDGSPARKPPPAPGGAAPAAPPRTPLLQRPATASPCPRRKGATSGGGNRAARALASCNLQRRATPLPLSPAAHLGRIRTPPPHRAAGPIRDA